jgi:hypothetical protein
LINWELSLLDRFSPRGVFSAFFASLTLSLCSRAALQLEILALRHQLSVLQRSVTRPKLTTSDRLLWAWLCRVWPDWRSALVIVKPDTVIAWHRKGFRLFWTWNSRRGGPGRPAVPQDVRELIRRMSHENPLWGAPPIHGELLKLGVNVGETSVGKYMGRRRQPPSQTWRTFLKNRPQCPLVSSRVPLAWPRPLHRLSPCAGARPGVRRSNTTYFASAPRKRSTCLRTRLGTIVWCRGGFVEPI